MESRVGDYSISDSPAALYDAMAAQGVERAYVLNRGGELVLSHPDLLAPIQAYLDGLADYDDHEGLFIGRGSEPGVLFLVAVHDTRRGLSQGGLRFKQYDRIETLFFDAVRLSRGMSYKSALADLWWGGGKAVMTLPTGYAEPKDLPEGDPIRVRCMREFARFVVSLRGVYVAAEDLGTYTSDMDTILSECRFVTCISEGKGGSGNPSAYTARGVLSGMEAAWAFLNVGKTLEGVTVSVQGAGHVGEPLIRLLVEAGARVRVCDRNPETLGALVEAVPGLEPVEMDAIYDVAADIFAPCAVGGVVNAETIPRLAAAGVRLVCGAANNILQTDEDAARLAAHGIAYAPDFVVNRMGIVHCANEQLGNLPQEYEAAAREVAPATRAVFERAEKEGVTTVEAAVTIAREKLRDPNPLFGHRGPTLVDTLIEAGWTA